MVSNYFVSKTAAREWKLGMSISPLPTRNQLCIVPASTLCIPSLSPTLHTVFILLPSLPFHILNIPSPSPLFPFHTLCSCLYVTLMALLLLVIGGLLIAFMFPRSVEVSIERMNTTNDWVNLHLANASDQLAILEMQVTMTSLLLFIQWISESKVMWSASAASGPKQSWSSTHKK